jgi:hydroxymethylpyrimidine/phosphomethylpyrimidine kinase
MRAVALTIAGSDPSGGAGIQADLKTFHQFGVYGEAVISLLTVQNTMALTHVLVMEPALVVAQLDALMKDIRPAAAKTGALGNGEVIEALADYLRDAELPLVVDPVMVSKHGERLMERGAESVLQEKLLRLATLVTPNIEEAEILAGMAIHSPDEMEQAARRIRELGVRAVLIKGGHLPGAPSDLLCTESGFRWFAGTRVATRHTHGTGCVYSAAITAALAQGDGLERAVARAKRFVQAAIASAPGLGGGNGPLNHFAAVPEC